MGKAGEKRAVLVGCNYPKTQYTLHGCINDVESMRDVILKRFGFQPSNVQVLTDAPGSKSVLPTAANIKAALNAMVKKAKPGDVLFFFYSGHGTAIPSLEPGKPFKQDDAIVPCDLNVITDEDFRHLVNRVPEGATFTIVSDSCNSGGLIDKEKEQIGPTVKKVTSPVRNVGKNKSIPFEAIHNIIKTVSNVAEKSANLAEHFSGFFGKDVTLKFHPQNAKGALDLYPLGEDEGILLSGCQPNEESLDLAPAEDGPTVAHGAFTMALLQVLHDNPSGISNKQLLVNARKYLKENGYEQHPCLYCNDENANTPFLGGRAGA